MATLTTIFGIAVIVQSDMPNSVIAMGYPTDSGALKPGYVVAVNLDHSISPGHSAGTPPISDGPWRS